MFPILGSSFFLFFVFYVIGSFISEVGRLPVSSWDERTLTYRITHMVSNTYSVDGRWIVTDGVDALWVLLLRWLQRRVLRGRPMLTWAVSQRWHLYCHDVQSADKLYLPLLTWYNHFIGLLRSKQPLSWPSLSHMFAVRVDQTSSLFSLWHHICSDILYHTSKTS